MNLPKTGHRIVSVLAGVLLAGTALATPAAADTHRTGPASITTQADQDQTATVYQGRITVRPGVLVRRDPSLDSPPIGSIPYGAVVEIVCKVNGGNVQGNYIWYRLRDGGWVPARWVSVGGIEDFNPVPWCTT
ncbi:SH3 domain-containing protein [Streptomyces sp. NPDC087420]|uniref:SH3 domain-containing protein n=1 Tax=Streptomyces sp. NPDC087420 TaxID=3365785 RepID=UPI003833A128